MIAEILIADDDAGVRNMLKDFLESRNHRVIVVEDGSQLVLKAQEHQPHLIIMDVQMPASYGTSAYEILQKDPGTARIPVLFISGAKENLVRKILPPESPKVRFMGKPIDLPALEKALSVLLPQGGYIP